MYTPGSAPPPAGGRQLSRSSLGAMAKDFSEAEKQTLTRILRRLGATNAESLAQSQLREGIDQLAIFVFLKQAWEHIIDAEHPDEWIDTALAIGAESRDEYWKPQADAIKSVLGRGVSRSELGKFIQCVQYGTLNAMCFLLDGNGFASPLNVAADEDWPRINWQLHQTDDEGKVLRRLAFLHEFSDGETPDGKQSGYR